MLYDDVLANGAPGSGCDISCLLPRIRRAQRFVLGPQFAAVAEELSGDYSGLVRVFDRCRLPYPETWIEVAQADRPRFMAAGIQAPGFQLKPRRVGMLLSATRSDLSAWKAHLFWCFDHERVNVALLAMLFDMTQPLGHATQTGSPRLHLRSGVVKNLDDHPGWTNASEPVRLAMLNHNELAPPDFGMFQVTKAEADVLFDLSRSDWSGEAGFMLAVIGLLNARNAVEVETVTPSAKLNRARRSRGKPPLLEHKVLKIALRQCRRAGQHGHADHMPVRGHFVRGHFKARKSGIYFWHPHARGDFGRGTVHKNYELA
jgi:hypothetical protein